MMPRFTRFFILACVLGCRTSPMGGARDEELVAIPPGTTALHRTPPALVAASSAPAVAVPPIMPVPASPELLSPAIMPPAPTLTLVAAPATQLAPVDPVPHDETPADRLAEASRCLERDDLKNAGAQLALYLDAKPEAQVVRVQYAEILAGLKRRVEARGQFNQFLAIAQEQKNEAGATMIHVHRRLMEIAEEANDEYGVHLNRGIGLFLLSQRRGQVDVTEQEMPVEGLLCKAAAELTLAHDERPNEAQVSWYLYQVWTQLGQRHPALVRLREAQDAARFTYLSPAESRKLSLACLDSLSERGTHEHVFDGLARR